MPVRVEADIAVREAAAMVSVIDEGQVVGRHTHEHAHFMLVVGGHYLRRRRGVTEVVRAPCLLFDPAATTHDDCFAKSEGSFVSLSVLRSDDAPVPDEPRFTRR